jgi:AcrR family transcriptional regulator
MATRPYRPRGGSERSRATRERIVQAVRELVAEGAFHESTVEQVADRAGVSRATLYQHFRSRIELIDALCETFSANPAIMEIRSVVDQPDGRSALDVTIADAHRFWSAEDAVLQPLYGLTGIDPAARELVERQRADRRGEMDRLAANLDRQGLLPDGTNRRRAVAVLLVLTSYETFRELRAEGFSDRQAVSLLQESGRALLIKPA